MPGVCPRCFCEVYFAEEKLALGKVWHKFCFTCRNCRKLLDSCTLATHSGELFCRNCYTRLFSASARPVPKRGKEEIVTDTNTWKTPPLKNSKSDYFLDSCCYCCFEECPLPNNKVGDSVSHLIVSPSEKCRFRGDGEQEESYHLEVRNQFCERENSNLCIRSITSVCNSIQNSLNDVPWINRQKSASQSTFGCQSCNKTQVAFPSSTPLNGISEVCRRFNNLNNNNSYLASRRAGSPRYFSNRQDQQGDDQPLNQFLQYKTRKADELESNAKPSQLVLSSGPSLKTLLSWTQHYQDKNSSPESPRASAKINHLKRQYLAYLPLPHNYIPSLRRKVSFRNTLLKENNIFEDQENHLTMRNVANDDILKEERRSYYDLDFENSYFCDYDEEVEENDRIKFVNRISTSLETIHEDYWNGRMRGGCGGGGCCGGRSPYGDIDVDYGDGRKLDLNRKSGGCGCGSSNGSYGCRTNLERKKASKFGGCCLRHKVNNEKLSGWNSSTEQKKRRERDENHMHTILYDRCPPRESDFYNSNKTPCSGCPPVYKNKSRYPPSCGGSTHKCGGGGCCGNGCRGGCGKPGQLCLPLRSCSNPPCKPHPILPGSPCLPPRTNGSQPPCLKIPEIMGISRNMSGKSGNWSKSAGRRKIGEDECCSQNNDEKNDERNDGFDQPKQPSSYKCLGGGFDCQRCGRKVYHAEMQIASGVPFHNICFSCFCCRRPLESLTYQENCGEIYCKQCYIRKFGPQGYGYGIGAGVLQTPI